MTAPVAVVDTNVVVSGLLTSEPIAPTRLILDAMLAGSVTYLLSVALLREYRVVLLRPAIRARHRLAEQEVDAILEALALNAVFRDPGSGGVECPDPGDAHLWALLAEHPRAVLVTGDQALLKSPPGAASVMTPATFAAALTGTSAV